MRVAVTGASGLIGRALTAQLQGAGHSVTRLVRSREAAASADTIWWSPARGEIDAASLGGHDAVFHLAGESLFGVWTAAKKRRILRSRVDGTDLLARTLAALQDPPAALVCASGVNVYGNRPGETVDEASPPGTGFLADVVQAWEAAAEPARQAGIRTVHMRQGVVLAANGGMLPLILPLFRLGLGGSIGRGTQPFAWVALDDAVGAAVHALGRRLEGPVNVVAPQHVSFLEFTRTLGRVLRRPTVFAVPAWLARMAPGGFADELVLAGADVMSRRLQESGYEFRWPELEPALRAAAGARAPAR
jgi:uncharacterized protein